MQLTWPAQQVVDFVSAYCAPFGIGVDPEESQPRGAVSLTFSCPRLTGYAAQVRIEQYRPYIQREIVKGEWEPVPPGIWPFADMTVICCEYKLLRYKEELVLLKALVDYDHRDVAKAMGFYWDGQTKAWTLLLRSRDLLTKQQECALHGCHVHVLRRWLGMRGVMVLETEDTPVDPVTRAGRTLAAMRRTFAGGRLRGFRPCKWCKRVSTPANCASIWRAVRKTRCTPVNLRFQFRPSFPAAPRRCRATR